MNTSLSILARALATENLTFSFHPDAPTASFDVKTRHLIMPLWDVTDTLMTMLVAHEISHALWTPADRSEELFAQAKAEGYNEEFLHRICNMIEDVRIEKMMKDKYPGTRRDFFLGYKEIIDRDMFGFSNMDLDRATMLSRLNLHFKWGVPGFLPITLTDEERTIAEEINTVETFDEMFALAKRLYNHNSLQQEREQFENEQKQSGEGTDGTPDPSGAKKDDKGKGNPVACRGDITDLAGAFSRKDGTKYNHSSITLTPVSNLQDLIVSPDILRAGYEAQGLAPNLDGYRKFVRESDAFVRQLVAQFERRKAADEIRRERPKQTGMLNLDRLHQFRTHDDIFLSKIIKQDGKNHGIMFLLDLSGSMGTVIGDCVQQVLQLIWFCEKAKIPFEVFGFTDGFAPGQEEEFNAEHKKWVNSNRSEPFVYSRAAKFVHNRANGVIIENTKLFNIASSRDSASKREELLCYLWETYISNGRQRVIRLGNTPTVEALILASQFMQKWVTENDIQIPTIMVVTDGDPNGIHVHGNDWLPYTITPNHNVTVYNEVTQTVHNLDGNVNPGNFLNGVVGTMLDSLRTTLNARCVGMFVGPKTLSESMFNAFCVSPKEVNESYKKGGMYSRNSISDSPRYDAAVESYKGGAVLVHPEVYPGFDAFFLMRSPKIVSDSEAFADGGFTKVKSTFIKTMAKRGGCRVFLTKYVDIVAGQPIRAKGDAMFTLPWRVTVK